MSQVFMSGDCTAAAPARAPHTAISVRHRLRLRSARLDERAWPCQRYAHPSHWLRLLYNERRAAVASLPISMGHTTGVHVPGLPSQRVYLRTLERTDIETTTRWMNSDHISDIMGYLPVKTLSGQYEWFAALEKDRSRFIFAICLNQDDRHIGNVALGQIDYISRHAMLSIFIADHTDQGKGYGSEATVLLLRFAFDRVNLHKVYLRTSSRFAGAIKMYERLGFIKEGVMRDHYYSGGAYEDKILYSMLRTEFRTLENSGLRGSSSDTGVTR